MFLQTERKRGDVMFLPSLSDTRELRQHGRQGRFLRVLRDVRMDTALYIMLIPGLAYFIIFKYVPMYGISIAFREYSVFKGFADAPYVGLTNFQNLFARQGFTRALQNNIAISAMKLCFGFPIPVILSLMINELSRRRYKKFIQTAIILPSFISWVVVNGLLFALFSPSTGAIKGVLTSFGVTTIPNIMGQKDTFRWVILLSYVWKTAGMGTVVYLAAISGIAPELYEAAVMDGAGRLRQLWNVTLPSIRSTIVVLLIFRVGEIMHAGFDQIFAISNPLVISVADIIDTYVYTLGLEQRKFSLATAAGLFQSLIGLVLVLVTNAIAKRIDPESGII